MERKYYKIAGHGELRRDSESMGIVNVDIEALNRYKEERELKRKVTKMVAEHERLQNDVGEMKGMLALILQKLGS